MIVPLYVNACTCLCLSHPSLFQSVYIHVSYRNTHTHTHTEHATHLKALYWGKSGYLFPVHLYTHVQICAHLYISGQPQQVVNQSLHTYILEQFPGFWAALLPVLLSSYLPEIQGWSIFCLLRNDFTLCCQCILPVLSILILQVLFYHYFVLLSHQSRSV